MYSLTIGEVAEIMHYSRGTILSRIHDKEIPAKKIGSRFIIDSSDLRNYLNKNGMDFARRELDKKISEFPVQMYGVRIIKAGKHIDPEGTQEWAMTDFTCDRCECQWLAGKGFYDLYRVKASDGPARRAFALCPQCGFLAVKEARE